MKNQNPLLEHQYLQHHPNEENDQDFNDNNFQDDTSNNHDLPLSGVAQTLQNFLNTTNQMNQNNSLSQQSQATNQNQNNHQNTANFNSVAQFSQLYNDYDYQQEQLQIQDGNNFDNGSQGYINVMNTNNSQSQQQVIFFAQQQQQEQQLQYLNQNSTDDEQHSNYMIKEDALNNDSNQGRQMKRPPDQNKNDQQLFSQNQLLPPRSHSHTYSGTFGSSNLLTQKQSHQHQQQQYSNNLSTSNNNKQVRFSIKDGLKNLIEDSSLDIESIASRSHSLNKGGLAGSGKNKSKQLQQQKKGNISKSPKGLGGGKSQQKKVVTYKTRQLALKYKREADESRRKKSNTDDIDNIDKSLNLSEDDVLSQIQTDRSQVNQKQIKYDVDQTPDQKISRQIIPIPQQQPQLQQEEIVIPKQVLQHIQFQQSNPAFINETNQNQKQQNLNTHQKQTNTILQSQMIGTIIKRDALSQTRDNQSQNNLVNHNQQHNPTSQLKNLQQLQQQHMQQPGTIMRRRSVSPGDALQFTPHNLNKENQSQNIMNSSVNHSHSNTALAGQIVKLSNQKLNQTTQNIPRHQYEGAANATIRSPKIIVQSERQPSRVINVNQPDQQIQQENTANDLQLKQSQSIMILFRNIWDCFKLPLQDVQASFTNSSHSLNQLRYQLLTCLTQQPRYPNSFMANNQLTTLSNNKLHHLRQSLSQLYQEKFEIEVLQILKLRDQKLLKQQQLKNTLKQGARYNSTSNQQLKIELLKDIISRLTQKIVLHTLLLNRKIKVEISAQFLAYYQEYIARDYKHSGFQLFKRYKQKRQEKNQYLYIARDQIKQVKLQQVFKAWKHIKEYKKNRLLFNQECKSILLSRRVARLLTYWKIVIITQRNLSLGYTVSIERQKLKLHQEIFAKWIYQHRTFNKIKRKALMMVSPNAKNRFAKNDGSYGYGNNSTILNDEEWLQNRMQQLKSQFNSKMQEYLLEREHNKTFINGLKFKVSRKELDLVFPLKSQHRMGEFNRVHGFHKDYTGAWRNNEQRIYQSYPEFRYKSKSPIRKQKNLVNLSFTNLNSANLDYPCEPLVQEPQLSNIRKSQELDIDLKYSIHSALVYQQNTARILSVNQPNENYPSQLSAIKYQNRSEFKQKAQKKLLPPPPKRLIELEQSLMQQQQNEMKQAPPNQIFKKLQEQLNLQNQQMPQRINNPSNKHDNSQQETLMLIPIDIQLREHIKTLKFKIQALEQISYNHHFKQSLQVNATNVLQSDQEEFSGLTDYIQYGISCDQYRMVFIKMFQTKAISVLFNQWKIKYLKRQLNQDLESLHIIKYAQQSFIEWNRVIKSRKLKIKEFDRTKQVHKFYRIFIKWAEWNRQNSQREKVVIEQFRVKTVFKNWIKYLDSQGQNLLKILRSQQYFKQALMSKGLLSLYKNYLKELRVKRFQRKLYYRRYFQQKWQKCFLKRKILQKIVNKVNDRVILNERLKYQREFEIKKEVLSIWHDKAQEKLELIQQYTALTHYKQTLICKSFIGLKKNQRYSIGSKLLISVILNGLVRPVFNQIQDSIQSQKKTEVNFMTYRQNYLKAEVFNILRQSTVENRLSKLFMKKRVFKAWQKINLIKNHELPYQYRTSKLKSYFFSIIKLILKQKWAEERSVIIEKNLVRQKDLKLKKVIFVKLLENILIEKRSRIVNQTVSEFRDHNLVLKVFRGLKSIWSHKNTERIMKKVARDFHAKIVKRRQLKKRQYYESKGIQYIDDNNMTKNRIFNAWRLHTEHKLTKNLVLKRFLEFKRRFQTLRTFLAWRSMAKYEHTPSHHNKSRQSILGGLNTQVNSNFKPLDTTHRSSTPSNSNYPNLPLQVQSPQFTQRASVGYQNQQMPSLSNKHQSQQQSSQQLLPQAIHREHSFNQNDYESQQYYQNIQSKGNMYAQGTTNNQQFQKHHQYQHNIIGDQDLTQIKPQIDETPFKLNDQAQDKSLFDELENIFQKNKKWLDEQKEREDFLREMASHYNQRLSQEMNSIRYNTLTQSDQYKSLSTINK